MDPSEGTGSVMAPTPQPQWWLVLVSGMLALLVAVSGMLPAETRSRRLVFVLNGFATIVHEAGHALACVLTGGAVRLIQVFTPASGRTRTLQGSWLSNVITTAAGYAAPPMAGLGAAALLSRGHAPMVLTLTVVATALILVVSRSLVTVASVLTVGLVAFMALVWGGTGVQHVVAYTEAWLLLLTETGGLWAIVHNRMRGRPSDTDDAGVLARKTGIPATLWIAGWATLNGWAIWTGVPLLWP